MKIGSGGGLADVSPATTTDDDEDDGEEAMLGPPSSSEKVRSLRELLRRGVGQKFDLRAYVWWRRER